MICPICGGANLVAKKDIDKDPHDHTARKRDEKIRETITRGKGLAYTDPSDQCPKCNFEIVPTWKYCPECGIRFSTYSRDSRD